MLAEADRPYVSHLRTYGAGARAGRTELGEVGRIATLRQRLRLGVLAVLDQRISMRYAITGMNTTETSDYITHHLKIAGRADTLFSADAITLIHNAFRGYPRAVNNLAINALPPRSPATAPSSTRKQPA